MTRHTIYCVQSYRRQGRGLEVHNLRSFGRLDDASEACERWRARFAAVVLFKVEVDSDVELCGDPVILRRAGGDCGAWRDPNVRRSG